MKKVIKIVVLSLVFLITFACSTKKNAFLNRNYHALTTKYNVLFNGKEAFYKGLKQLSEQHQDNFWKRLPIEPITFDESKAVGLSLKSSEDDKDTQSLNPFDRAEEKAVKAIQKHSMRFKGYEKNPQIDDAYLLLGKSRYYTQRFIPAIEAYNYILANYPNANLNYETRVWRAKANTRLGNERIAIQAIKLLLSVLDKNEKIPKRIEEQAHTAMAMAYAETDTIEKVVEHLKKATKTFINKEQSARNMFVLGQVYSELNQKDSARMVFKKLADTRRAPEKYRIHANIELVKNAANDSSDVLLIKRFKKLIRNSDNRKYYDELYYQIATLYKNTGNTKKAVDYYKKSLNSKNGSAYQKTYTYEGLGNTYFKQSDYLLASAYYDSVLQVVPKEYENEKRIRRIKRKNKGLFKLKKYEDLLKNNDSILNIVAMSDEDRATYFKNYIEKIKKKDEERRQQLANSQFFGNSFGGGASFSTKKSKGKWYFYNTQSKQFGSADFERIWGNRPLKDNWRWSDKTSTNVNTKTDINSTKKSEQKYELSTYLNTIPKDPKKIDQLKDERNDALYQLGLIYKEQFKNTDIAIQNLERLQSINTDKELELPIKYHLYQLYSEKGLTAKANQTKIFILQKHPYSKFADIIQNPNKKSLAKEDEDLVTKKYKEIYYLYRNKKYENVVNQINSYSKTIDKSDLIPKFALLRALAIGKYQSKENYKEALQFIVFSYANTEEGKKAQEIINLLK